MKTVAKPMQYGESGINLSGYNEAEKPNRTVRASILQVGWRSGSGGASSR